MKTNMATIISVIIVTIKIIFVLSVDTKTVTVPINSTRIISKATSIPIR